MQAGYGVDCVDAGCGSRWKISPVLTPEQEAAIRRELDQQLYNVFLRYAHKRRVMELMITTVAATRDSLNITCKSDRYTSVRQTVTLCSPL